jgi:hypothetical protein
MEEVGCPESIGVDEGGRKGTLDLPHTLPKRHHLSDVAMAHPEGEADDMNSPDNGLQREVLRVVLQLRHDHKELEATLPKSWKQLRSDAFDTPNLRGKRDG